jgi:capsular exopolysaccharide synthesis family protein
MSRIHEALQKARKHPLGSEQELPDIEEVITVGVEGCELPQNVAPSSVLGGTSIGLAEDLHSTEMIDPLLAKCVKHDWPRDGKNLVLLSKEGDAPGQEQFRTLRSRLYQMRATGDLKVLVVSSALPEEGKSFVSANLAHAFASQSGRRALVIDADMRRAGGLSNILEAPSTPGLADYLLGERRVEEIIQTGSLDRLYFIASGKRVATPGDLIGDVKLGVLLEQLRPMFDWIIIDTPPVLPIADARLVADLSDGVLMVVNSTATLSHLAKRASQEFRRESLIGVVLNRASDPSATRYSTYGYGYGAVSRKSAARSET